MKLSNAHAQPGSPDSAFLCSDGLPQLLQLQAHDVRRTCCVFRLIFCRCASMQARLLSSAAAACAARACAQIKNNQVRRTTAAIVTDVSETRSQMQASWLSPLCVVYGLREQPRQLVSRIATASERRPSAQLAHRALDGEGFTSRASSSTAFAAFRAAFSSRLRLRLAPFVSAGGFASSAAPSGGFIWSTATSGAAGPTALSRLLSTQFKYHCCAVVAGREGRDAGWARPSANTELSPGSRARSAA